MTAAKELQPRVRSDPRVFVGLGSNLGDRFAHLRYALRCLARDPLIRLERTSAIYETEPVGFTAQPRFLNAVAELYTSIPPRALLERLKRIERRAGRVQGERWGPRALDLDILTYGNVELFSPELKIPHQEIRNRAFVVVPLAELAPGLQLPGDPIDIEAWRRRRSDLAGVRKVGDPIRVGEL